MLDSPSLFKIAGAAPAAAATADAAVALRPPIDAPWSERVPIEEKTCVRFSGRAAPQTFERDFAHAPGGETPPIGRSVACGWWW